MHEVRSADAEPRTALEELAATVARQRAVIDHQTSYIENLLKQLSIRAEVIRLYQESEGHTVKTLMALEKALSLPA